MGVTEYFFDSYAAIEILKKNPTYASYVEKTIKITFLNLLEITYITLIEHGNRAAAAVFNKFKDFVVEVPDNVTLESIKFRASNRKNSLSYADCLGYTYAGSNGLIFLTGDDAFAKMPGVEFVK